MTEEYTILKRLKLIQEIFDAHGYRNYEPINYIWRYFTRDDDAFPENIEDWVQYGAITSENWRGEITK